MPPMLSDEESQSEAEIEARNPEVDPKEEEEEEEEDEDEDDEGNEDPDEYVVEKITNHAFEDDGECKYLVKWQGYSKKSDQTWEPEENLSSAQEVLAQYFKQIGGRPKPSPEPSKGGKGRKRSSTAVASPAAANGRGKKNKTAPPEDTSERRAGDKSNLPKGSWEGLVNLIETIEEVPNPTVPGEQHRVGYVLWNAGNRTQHPLKVLNQKCPQKMLVYYESHLVFRPSAKDDDEEEEEIKGTNGS